MSRFMPCEHCGASVDRTASTPHECSPERRIDFAVFQLRQEVAAFDSQVSAYLSSSRGRFASWLAARQVRSTR
jgi:hypothetical protein